MIRVLLAAAVLLLASAPAGIGVGLWLAVSAGAGVAAGSAAYGLLALWALTADLLPAPQQSEAVR